MDSIKFLRKVYRHTNISAAIGKWTLGHTVSDSRALKVINALHGLQPSVGVIVLRSRGLPPLVG